MGADGIEYDKFEKELTKNIRNISRRIKDGTYLFYPLYEKRKLKPNGKYRILSVSSIRDALVQRQIYEIIYPKIEEKFAQPSVNYTSFAYRKNYSAPRAISHVRRNINDGYLYAVDADLSSYFDTLKHDVLLEKIEACLGQNPRLIKLLRRFISSRKIPVELYSRHRKNRFIKKENSRYKIFKMASFNGFTRPEGVPQGGMLSGLLANLYLSDFDWWVINTLGKEVDLRYVRYADDFLVMIRNKEDLDRIKQEINAQIQSLGLRMNIDKTKKIDIAKRGIVFLGFKVTKRHISVSDANVIKFKNRFRDVMSRMDAEKYRRNTESKTINSVVNRINFKILGIKEDNCPKCSRSISGRPRSWIAFFSVIDDIAQLKEIDKWIRVQLYSYLYKNYGLSLQRDDLNNSQLKSLEREYYRIKHIKTCQCPEEEDSYEPF